MIHPDCRGTMLGGPHCQSPYDMVMGIMKINNVKSFLIDIARDISDVGNNVLETKYVMRFGNRREMKGIVPFESFLSHPLLHTLRSLDGGTPVGEDYLVPSLMEGQAEVHHRLGRSRPLPIGEEVENFHSACNPSEAFIV